MRLRISWILLGLGGFLALLVAPPSARAEELPPEAVVDGVVGHPQERRLSCESRSATDLASFWGARFTEDAFFRRLPKSDNPQRGFVGDVDMPAGSMPPEGYGVYGEPIAATLRSFGLDAKAHRATELNRLKQELAAQRPVVVWATYDMQLPGAETWVSSDGVASSVVRWQHTFVAIGYDQAGLYLIDAYDGVTKYFLYEVFVPAWEQLDRLAVTVRGPHGRSAGRTWLAQQSDDRCRFLVDGRWTVGPE